MESYAGRLSEIELWNLVNFIRTLGPRTAAPSASIPRPVVHHVHLNVVV